MIYLVRKILPYSLIIITITGLAFSLPIPIPLATVWICNLLICIIYIKAKSLFPQTDKAFILIYFYFLWNIFTFTRGMFIAENYWDWKMLLNNGFQMLIPIFCFTFSNPKILSRLLNKWMKYSLYIFPVFLILSLNTDTPGRYLSFFYLYIICISTLPKKWKLIIIVISTFSIFYDIDARSNGIRVIACLGISLMIFWKYKRNIILKILQPSLMILPIILFYLAAANTFNIFKISDYIGNIESKGNNLTADTRTGLYDEVIQSSIKNKYIILGRTPAKGYESNLFSLDDIKFKQIGIRSLERYGCEVSILNIYHQSGLIGIILYFSIFFYASFIAIYRSNNIFIKLIGIFIAFRWSYSWVEDFNIFDINYTTLWMLIAMCFSKNYRIMSNKQFRLWILSSLPFGVNKTPRLLFRKSDKIIKSSQRNNTLIY